jgi:hypothetical protein
MKKRERRKERKKTHGAAKTARPVGLARTALQKQ